MTYSHELRIGNLIAQDDSGQYYQLKSGADIDNHTEGFSPIALTQEVLSQCGFAFHEHFKIWQKNRTLPQQGPDMELDLDFWVLDFSHHRIGVALKSLHQLQNFYFAMKGKELEIQA